MSTDLEQRIREALVAVLTAATGVQTVAGRSSDLVVAFEQLAPAIALPALAYRFSLDEATGDGPLQLTALAAGPTAAADVRRLLEAAAAALTTTAFAAQSLDLVPLVDAGVRRGSDEPIAFDGIPDLQQAEWSLVLRYLY